MREQILDRNGQVVVRVEQARRTRDDAVAVTIRIVAPSHVEAILESDQGGHRIGRGAIHANLAVMVESHEGEGGVRVGVDERDVELVGLCDRNPERQGAAAHRVSAEAQPSTLDRLDIDHIAQVLDVGPDEVVVMDVTGAACGCQVHAADRLQPLGQDLVGAILDDLGHAGVRRAARGWIVLEAAIRWGVVRRRDDNAIGHTAFVAAVVGQDGMRDDRRRREDVVGLDHHMDFVRRENLDRRVDCGSRQRVAVHADVQGAIVTLSPAILGNGLRNGGDMIVVEALAERLSAVARGAEGHRMGRIPRLRVQVIIGRKQLVHINKILCRRRLAGKRVSHRNPPYQYKGNRGSYIK